VLFDNFAVKSLDNDLVTRVGFLGLSEQVSKDINDSLPQVSNDVISFCL
jgi:hypothetical protein